MMTSSWTDLIDTDPMRAWELYKKQEIDSVTTLSANDLIDEVNRLMTNLAALCEALADPAMCHVRGEAKGRMSWAMDMYRNPDGSRRFPEVK